MECRTYQGDLPTLEFYLEADTPGRVLCWWLEAKWEEPAWLVEASVLINRDLEDWQHTLRAFPDQRVETLLEVLPAAAAELLATTDEAGFFAADV